MDGTNQKPKNQVDVEPTADPIEEARKQRIMEEDAADRRELVRAMVEELIEGEPSYTVAVFTHRPTDDNRWITTGRVINHRAEYVTFPSMPRVLAMELSKARREEEAKRAKVAMPRTVPKKEEPDRQPETIVITPVVTAPMTIVKKEEPNGQPESG